MTERRRHQLYGRRKGPKLSAHQQSLMDNLLPKLALGMRAGADPRTYFSSSAAAKTGPRGGPGGGMIEDVWLEVGFGAGEHLLAQAIAHPDVGLIGAEPYEAGVAKLLSRLEKENVRNIRIHMGDARDVIAALPDSSLGKVFVLFPDPWPKTRHHKRRFIQMDTLDQIARVLKPGGELRFASDDADYVAWALERLMAHGGFAWNASRASGWRTRPANWPQTRYEAKALHGPPAWLSFRRL